VTRTSKGVAIKTNRSIPQATVIPVLIYPDVREAVAWLTEAFGFAERVRIGENHRSQLRFGDGAGSLATCAATVVRRARGRSPIRSWFGWRTPAPTASMPGRTAP
jgi:hypothetical protein